MSDIKGVGWGSAHDWERVESTPDKSTLYVCRKCPESFRHFYDYTPDIFEAMRDLAVNQECV